VKFTKYQKFRVDYDGNYEFYYKKYPYAFLLLDYLAQLQEHKSLTGSWVKDSDFEMYTNTVMKTDAITRIYCVYLDITSHFFRNRNKKLTIHIGVDDKKFPGIHSAVTNIAKKNDWNVIRQSSSDSSVFDLACLRHVSPYRFFISNKTKYMFSQFQKLDRQKWWRLLNDELFMGQLNWSLERDVRRTKNLVERLGIDVFINTGDSSGNARVLIEASKRGGFKTISLAHGYIVDDELLGIAPIRSDKLILWTEKQVAEVSAVMTLEETRKLAYIGFPKKFISGSSRSSVTTSLILMGYIEGIIKDKALRKVLEKVITKLKSLSVNVKLRLHPHERSGVPDVDDFVSACNVCLSTDDLSSEIASAHYIVGANTSSLLEAVSSGQPVYEIKEFVDPELRCDGSSVYRAEGVIEISVDALENIADIDCELVCNKEFYFDEEKVTKKLYEILASMHMPSLN
jgi:hypothetical protein